MWCQEELYHACTNGLSQDLMFCDTKDFVQGMNDIPVCALSTGIKIYAFCLMNNHVHFVLKGQYDDCLKFMRLYKQMRSRRLRARHGATAQGLKSIVRQVVQEDTRKHGFRVSFHKIYNL